MSQASKRRQSSSEDEGGGASWMDTYGDLVTLLLCFFVLLFSFSSIDAEKWEALAGAFSGKTVVSIPGIDPATGFQDPIDTIMRTESSDSTFELPSGYMETMEKEYEAFMQLYLNISSYVELEGIDVIVDPDFETYEVTISFANDILFDSGRAVIREDMINMLDHMVTIMDQEEDYISMISIEGHTDNVPIAAGNLQFEDNWDLSTARARSVHKYIMRSELVSPQKLHVSGYGEWQPILSNDTEEGRARNRRVDFIFKAYKTF